MALQRSSGELPAGVTILSESDAIEYQWKTVLTWKPRSDVWPFTYGIGMLGGLSTLAGLYINSHYRNKLRLLNHGRISSYLPVVILPTVMSSLFHQQVVTNDVLIQKTACPVCVSLRAAAIQSFFGFVYPCLLAPLAGFMFATRCGTYNIPSLTTDHRKVFTLWQKFTRPAGNIFLAICAVQAFAAMAITHYEVKSFFKVQSKLDQLEKYFDEKDDVHNTYANGQ